MQKFYLYCLLFLLLPFHVFTQPVLLAKDCNPVVGDVFIISSCNGVTNVGAPGANQTWDLSNLTSFYSITHTCNTSIGSLFPNASINMTSNTGNVFYDTSSSSFELKAWIDQTNTVHDYTNKEDILHFPFQMGDSFSDAWSSTYDNGIQYYRDGTSVVTADGYGTLQLPIGNFDNVLRVKTVQHYIDSVWGLGNVYEYDNTMYSWYRPGQHQAIATVSSLVINGSTPILTASYLSSLVTGVENIQNSESIAVFPNPASSDFTVACDLENENVSFVMTDVLGRKCSLDIERKASNQYHITPLKLHDGLYTLHIIRNKIVVGSKQIQIIN